MELWLIRHGKAEKIGRGQEDAERRLIEKGREQAACLSNYLAACAKGRKVEFWTSSFARARETTSILMSSFEGVPHIKAEISEGDLTTLLPLWEKSQADIQVVVGHEPFLSEWTQKLTGQKIDFQTGSLAKIKVMNWIPPKGKLLFYMSSDQFLEEV